MTEFTSSEGASDTRAVERAIRQKVAAFSGEAAIQGFKSTEPNLLDEFEKDQIWQQWAETVWPTNHSGLLSEEEIAVLTRMRQANPSDEDRIWATV